MPRKPRTDKYTVEYRFHPLYLDNILTNWMPVGRYEPYDKLVFGHNFKADVRDDKGNKIGTVAEPKIPEYESIFKGRLISVDGTSLITKAEWTSDLPHEYAANNGQLEDKDRLLSLVLELYTHEEDSGTRSEREEYHLNQRRKGFTEHWVSLPINIARYGIDQLKRRRQGRRYREKEMEFVELGELYNTDFSIKRDVPLELDEDVVPQRVNLNAKGFTLHDSTGEKLARIYAKPIGKFGKRVWSLGRKQDYVIEVDRRHRSNEDLLMYLVALTDFIHNKGDIRKEIHAYESAAEVPAPSKIMGWD